jgi:hypothetical protein
MRIDSAGMTSIRGTSAVNGSSPVTLQIYDAASSGGWTAGANFAQLQFYSNDASAAAVRAQIHATQTNAAGTQSDLVFSTYGASLTEALRITSGKGIQIARTAVTAPAESDGNVFSGTYTPTLTNTTNVASSTASSCQYMRVGNVVTVSGQVDITPTSAGAITVLGVSLPIASNLSAGRNCCGTSCIDTTVVAVIQAGSGVIVANGTDDIATFRSAPSDTTSRPHRFSFTYLVQ